MAGTRRKSGAGSICFRSGRTLSVTITDLSALGCKVQSAEMLPIGEIVDLDLGGGDTRKASIRWSVLDRAGLLFM